MRITNRDAHPVGAHEDLGGVFLLSHAIQGTGRAEHEGVARTPSARENDEVDDVGHDVDAGASGGDDEGRGGGGVRVGAQQLRVVGGHEHADEEDAEHVKDGHTPEDALGGNGDVAPGALGLGGGLGDILDATVFLCQSSRRNTAVYSGRTHE